MTHWLVTSPSPATYLRGMSLAESCVGEQNVGTSRLETTLPLNWDVIHLEHQGRRQMILPAYSLSAGIDSVLVTMHVPRFVSIGSPGWGGAGSSTLSTSSKLAAWMVMM